MLSNAQFLEVIRQSFRPYLEVNTSRSTAKLVTLHGHIAEDLSKLFGSEFTIKSQGYGDKKEDTIDGRYYPKYVDITVKKEGKAVAGYAVKFVMRNYSQNSNNYFENMLGETANIRSNSIPYFQIFIIFEKVPYYKKGGEFSHYETIYDHYLDKYFVLSNDEPETYYHTPDKTLFVLLRLKEPDYSFEDSEEYADYYKSVIDDKDLMSYSSRIEDDFGNNIILNNYEDFIKRTYHIVMGKLKS